MTRAYTCKTYDLSDGTVLTAREVASKYDVPLSTTRTRLSNGITDIEVLNKAPMPHKQNRWKNASKPIPEYMVGETVKQRRQRRNFNDPMSRLFLKMS